MILASTLRKLQAQNATVYRVTFDYRAIRQAHPEMCNMPEESTEHFATKTQAFHAARRYDGTKVTASVATVAARDIPYSIVGC